MTSRDVRAPNGIALPDERTLYISNADRDDSLWLAYRLALGGCVGAGREFANTRGEVMKYAGVPVGMETDARGNLWAAGPGGLTCFAPDGTRLGFLITGIATSNVTFGGLISASSAIWRIEARVRGTAGARN